GVMIGRAARGRPWLPSQIAHVLYGTPAPVIPTGDAFAEMVADHYIAMLRFYGDTLGAKVARKHLGWYMDHCGTPASLRHALLTARGAAQAMPLIRQAMAGTPRLVAA